MEHVNKLTRNEMKNIMGGGDDWTCVECLYNDAIQGKACCSSGWESMEACCASSYPQEEGEDGVWSHNETTGCRYPCS